MIRYVSLAGYDNLGSTASESSLTEFVENVPNVYSRRLTILIDMSTKECFKGYIDNDAKTYTCVRLTSPEYRVVKSEVGTVRQVSLPEISDYYRRYTDAERD